MSDYDPEQMMDETEAATYLGINKRTLGAWRRAGRAPIYARLSVKEIRYKLKDIDTWIMSKLKKGKRK